MNRFFKRIFNKIFGRKFTAQIVFPQQENVRVSTDFYAADFFVLQLIGWERIKISEYVQFRFFCSILCMNQAKLTIHRNVFFNNYCSINCLDSIEIGENTIFGEGVKLYDHNHKYSFDGKLLNIERNDFTTAPIKIGKNCWIGSNVTILKGVTIGDHVIVGANCLIYKSVPSNSIVKHSEAIITSVNE